MTTPLNYYTTYFIYIIKLTFRANYDEAFKKEPAALVVLSPSSEINRDQFREYVDYFLKKSRAGVV